MTRIIADIQNVSVKYLMEYEPRQALSFAYSRLFKKKSIFMALENISLTAYDGEVLAIVGKNGAGKSTLLKVIAQTLYPDEGSIYVTARSTSFVSMGLGFRNELSGYDNMNFTLRLLGTPKADMEYKKEEIIEFTKLSKFIHQPISNYSAGMRARLAFAIATANIPELLIMDEIIGTGDEEFRIKCKERISNMISKSKTVVFSSHNLNNIKELASRAIWLENGQVKKSGNPEKIISEYKAHVASESFV